MCIIVLGNVLGQPCCQKVEQVVPAGGEHSESREVWRL